MAVQYTDEQLEIMVEQGAQAVRLMRDNPFFKDVLVPALEEDIAQLEAGLAWAPGVSDKTTEAIALDRVWRSGILRGMANLWVKLNKFKNDGLMAEKQLGLQTKKNSV